MRIDSSLVRRDARGRSLVRDFLSLAALVILVCQPGCQMFQRFRVNPASTTPVAFDNLPSKQELIAFLSQRAERVSQIQSDVKVSIAGMPSLRGTLAIERPKNLRLTAGLLGVSELGVDVGSNDEVFWFLTKVAAPGEEPGIYFANHEQYKNSALQRAIPIDPSWIIDSMGFIDFDSSDRVEGPIQRPDGLVEIHTYRTIGNLPTVRKTVINPKFGWILQQSIYDSQGRLVAYSNGNKQEYLEDHDVSLPRQIQITAYDPSGSQLTLTIDVSRYRINSIFGDPDKLWSMPNPGDVKLIDLVNSQAHPVRTSASLDSTGLMKNRISSGTARQNDSRRFRIR